MTFLKFRIGKNNYELTDVTDCHSLNGCYFESLTEKARVYNLVLTGESDYIVGQLFGDEIVSLGIGKMMFVSLVDGYSTATDHIAMEYALQYLNTEQYKRL